MRNPADMVTCRF